jgi:two-component system, OmpR family, alkaline phosphatase synthesis response regulator PhoP
MEQRGQDLVRKNGVLKKGLWKTHLTQPIGNQRVPRRDDDLPDVFRVGHAVVHRRTGRVLRPGGERRLRAKELELLTHLYRHATTTLTRQELLRDVWNFAATVTRTVDQTVATLRNKIELDPEQPQLLQTVYGIGYRLML